MEEQVDYTKSFIEPVPTAQEFIKNYHPDIVEDLLYSDTYITLNDIYGLMIEFAKLHVEAALKEADTLAAYEFSEKEWEMVFDKRFILNAYPLSNIK